jgi:hypothetical protein
VLEPVDNVILPPLPSDETPVFNVIPPLTPATPASDVLRVKAPLDVSVETPDIIVTDPELAQAAAPDVTHMSPPVYAWPAVNEIDPPDPTSSATPVPALIDISPPVLEVAVVVPAEMQTPPPLPLSPLPTARLI